MHEFKSILVHLDGSPTALPRLTLAHRLAEQHGGLVTALYATTPVDLQYPLAYVASFDAATVLRDLGASRRERARTLFDDAVAAGLTRLRWAELAPGQSLDRVMQRALHVDLLVLGQHQPGGPLVPDVPADFVEWLLMGSGRPALVVPYIGLPASAAKAPAAPRGAPAAATVLVAWKATRESARALAAALPLLQSAAVVHVALWDEAGSAVEDDSSAVLAHLQAHGVSARVHRSGPASADPGGQMLSLASDLGADLLVMGCYGHGRAREWLMGGASKGVLASMTLPVLMVH